MDFGSEYNQVYPELYESESDNIFPEDNVLRPKKVWIYRRNVIAILAFFGFFAAYTLRTNVSVAVVAMTQNLSVTVVNETVMKQEFLWDSRQKGYVLGSFFYGYVFTQIFGGWLSIKIGGAKVFGAGIFITAVIAVVTPFMVRFGLAALISLRVAQGLFQGATYPSMHAVWARWAPPNERTRLATAGFSGGFVGTMFTFPLCGYLAEFYGWAYTFYVPGALSIIFCIIWFILVRDDPAADPRISEEEFKHLRDTLGQSKHKDIKHPWISFLLSLPVWAIIVSHFCENWGFYTMVTMLTTYLVETLGYEVKTAGLLSSLPFLLMGVGLPIAGVIVDAFKSITGFSQTMVRKIFNCGGFLVQLVFMIGASFVGEPIISVVFISLAIGSGAFPWAAFGVNHLDIAAPHAGVLMGLSNMMATFAGVISPSMTGYLVVKKNKEEWNKVFYICGAFYLFGAVFYAIFGSAEKQPWVSDVKEPENRISERASEANSKK